MNNRNDDLKSMRMDHETQFINQELVELLANTVIQDLVDWSNQNIYGPLGGELSFSMPAFGAPNARAVVYLDEPYKPVIEIRLSMFLEIYRDAFTFPMISKRIERETKDIENFHESFMAKFDERFMFKTGIPLFDIDSCSGVLKPFLYSFLEVFKEVSDDRIESNDVACRFVFFEIVSAWIFFHELGHLVQRHYMLKQNKKGVGEVDIVEIEKPDSKADSDVSGQAREVLADIEGLDLTLKYMKRKNILTKQSLYILLCGVSCMYQRFYQGYEKNLDLASGAHPHPVIRNGFFHEYALQWMVDYLKDDSEKVAIPLVYITVRSSFMSGLFWGHRIEAYDGCGLPTYMDLSSENYAEMKYCYMDLMRSEISEIINVVKSVHVLPFNSIAILEKCLTIKSTRTQQSCAGV